VTKQGVPLPSFPEFTEKNFIAWIFPLYFQLPYLPEGNLFSASWIFYGGRYQPACHYF
jgi:hypothetical protein